MSWGEVKKINSDLSEPLNYLAWIDDLATFGEDGYVFNTEALVNELASSSKHVLNNGIALALLVDQVVIYNSNVGAFFASITGDATGTFDGLTTMEAVVNSEIAMMAVANSETAMMAVANNATAMTAIANSVIAMTIIANSEVAMMAVANNATAMTAIANSVIAMTIIANSEIAMMAVANSETAMIAVFGITAAPNYMAREKIWDSVSASMTVMGSTTGRAWLVANVQLTAAESTSSGYVLKADKKCLVLSLNRYGDGTTVVKYKAIQPGGGESAGLSSNVTRIENKRVQPLSISTGNPNPDYANVRVYYVQMQA